MQKQDLEYIEQIKNGNSVAYTNLFNKYKKKLTYHISKMGFKKEDVEDIVIESITRAFLNLDTYEGTHAFSTWIYTITINGAFDFVRKNKRRIDTTDLMTDSDFITIEGVNKAKDVFITNEDPEFLAIRKEEYIDLMEGIERMQEPYKTIITMRYFDGFQYDEIAEKMHLAKGTIKTQIHRAKILLHKQLKYERGS